MVIRDSREMDSRIRLTKLKIDNILHEQGLIMLTHLIIRNKYKSPGHSSDRALDDTHEVKEKIIGAAAEALGIEIWKLEKIIGHNPDIDIIDDEIVLRRTNREDGARMKGTGLSPDGFFVMRFSLGSQSLFIKFFQAKPEKRGTAEPRFTLTRRSTAFVVPYDIPTIQAVCNHLIEREAGILAARGKLSHGIDPRTATIGFGRKLA